MKQCHGAGQGWRLRLTTELPGYWRGHGIVFDIPSIRLCYIMCTQCLTFIIIPKIIFYTIMIVYQVTIEFVILHFLACTKKAHHVILSMSCEGRYLIVLVRTLQLLALMYKKGASRNIVNVMWGSISNCIRASVVFFSWCIGFSNMFLFIRDDASLRAIVPHSFRHLLGAIVPHSINVMPAYILWKWN